MGELGLVCHPLLFLCSLSSDHLPNVVSMLFSNRASALIKLGTGLTFGDALRNADAALAWNPGNWKAMLWRIEALQVRRAHVEHFSAVMIGYGPCAGVPW